MEFAQGTPNAAFDGSLGQSEDGCGGAIGMTFEIRELQYPSLPLGKGEERFTHRFCLGDAEKLSVYFRLRGSRLVGYAALAPFACFASSNDVNGPAMGLRKKQRTHTSTSLVKPLWFLPQLHEHVLDDVLGKRFVIEDPSGKTGNGRSVSTKHLTQSGFVSSDNFGYEHIVGSGRIGDGGRGRRCSTNRHIGRCSSPTHGWISPFENCFLSR